MSSYLVAVASCIYLDDPYVYQAHSFLETLSILPPLKYFKIKVEPGGPYLESIHDQKTFRSLCWLPSRNSSSPVPIRQQYVFRFTNIPLKLQDMILVHTDLVPKSRDGVRDLVKYPNFRCGLCSADLI
jgi:hypothetical protein